MQLRFWILALAGSALLAVMPASAMSLDVRFDTWGNVSQSGQWPSEVMPSGGAVPGLDPLNPGGLAFGYLLPLAFQNTGDVQVLDPIGFSSCSSSTHAQPCPSDILRFENLDFGSMLLGAIFVYSGVDPNEIPVPPSALGFPPGANPLASFLAQGSDQYSWIDYTPAPSEPGFIDPDRTATYYFTTQGNIDGPVPEPETLVLLCGGLVVLRVVHRHYFWR